MNLFGGIWWLHSVGSVWSLFTSFNYIDWNIQELQIQLKNKKIIHLTTSPEGNS